MIDCWEFFVINVERFNFDFFLNVELSSIIIMKRAIVAFLNIVHINAFWIRITYVFFVLIISTFRQRVILSIVIYNFSNTRFRDTMTTNSSFYFFVRNSNRTKRETTMSSFDIEKKRSNEFFFFEENDNFFVLSSKTFILMSDLIDIIDLKLNQIIQSSIDKQKFQKFIHDFVRVFFTIFFFHRNCSLRFSSKNSCDNNRF